MGLITVCKRLATSVKKAFSWNSASGSSSISGQERFGTTRNSAQWLEVFRRNSRVRGPVNRIAEDVAHVRFRLYRRLGITPDGRVDREEIYAHPILDLLRHPNPYHTWSQFCKLGMCYNELAGTWASWIDRETQPGSGVNGALPLRLWPIRPQDVLRMPTKERPYWEFNLRGKRKKARLGDMLWIVYTSLEDPYGYGAGAADAVADEVAQDSYAGEWNTNFFRKGAHIGKMVVIPGLAPGQREAFKADFLNKTSGIGNAHEPFVVGGGTGTPTISDLGPSHKDLDFVPGKRHLRDTINQNWGVPPEIQGILENSNRATIDAAVNIYQRTSIAPKARFLEEQFNHQIVPLFGEDNLYLEWDNPVQETQEFILNQTTKGLLSGTVQGNEWRIKNGLPPVPGWDCFFIPVNYTVVHRDEDPRGISTAEDGQVRAPLVRPQTPPDELAEDVNEEQMAKVFDWIKDCAPRLEAYR